MRWLLSAVLAAVVTGTGALGGAAMGHFVFVVPEEGETAAKVIMSETLLPDEAVDVAIIGALKLQMRDAAGRETPLTLTKAAHAYTTTYATGDGIIHGMVDLGYTQRGQGKPHVLLYYPKTILGDAFGPKNTVGGAAAVELVPVGKPGATRLRLVVRGKPLPNAEVSVILPEGKEERVKTDAEGLTTPFAQTGRIGAWARFWEPTPGEREGKKFEEVRHYATLVFDVPKAAASAATQPAARRVGTLPEPTSSFGAAVADGWLYVYGGHVVRTHSYAIDSVSGRFSRAKLTANGVASEWEKLPAGPPAQGMNLVAHGGKIYRIGGMQPQNKNEDPQDLRSLAECARFDPASGRWEPLPPMPEGRSSHDVVVVGDKLIVIGGWNLRGEEETQWFDTALVMDLAASTPEWKRVPQPFKRRAMIAAVHGGKVYVLGGFSSTHEILADVEVYDPAANAWSKAPALPDGEKQAFGPAACTHEGRLYVSLAEGGVLRLNEEAGQWEHVGKASPRIVHRMVPVPAGVLVMGGALKGANLDAVELVEVK